jgi:hypothetical protein
MSTKVYETQQVTLTFKPKDHNGEDLQATDKPTWTTSNPQVVAVTPSEDGLSATVVPTAQPGKATISVVGNVDYNGSTVAARAECVVEFVRTPPPTATIEAGEPEERTHATDEAIDRTAMLSGVPRAGSASDVGGTAKANLKKDAGGPNASKTSKGAPAPKSDTLNPNQTLQNAERVNQRTAGTGNPESADGGFGGSNAFTNNENPTPTAARTDPATNKGPTTGQSPPPNQGPSPAPESTPPPNKGPVTAETSPASKPQQTPPSSGQK